MLDEFTRPRVTEGTFDEIFVGQKPILMGVEPNSFCWVVGDFAENRDGPSWARHFDGFEHLEHAVTDAGTGLLKGLSLSNERRQQAGREPIAHSLDSTGLTVPSTSTMSKRGNCKSSAAPAGVGLT